MIKRRREPPWPLLIPKDRHAEIGAAALNTRDFMDRKDELYWQLRRISSEVDIDPDDEALAAQLGSIKWDYGPKSRIKIESKKDMKKRKMPSPDRADAMMMTLFDAGEVATDPADEGVDESLTGDLLDAAW